MRKKIIGLIVSVSFILSGIVYAASLSVESDSQEFNDNESKIYLEGNVKVKTGGVNVNSPRAVVEIDPKNNKVNNVQFKENNSTCCKIQSNLDVSVGFASASGYCGNDLFDGYISDTFTC